MTAQVAWRRLPHGAGLPIPGYATAGAAGMDLRAAVDATVAPRERRLIPTGFEIALPEGFEGQVRPRSGWALRSGLTVLNAPGTIDADYRGELMLLMVNLGLEPVHVERGDRIAQLVVARVDKVASVEVHELDPTARGGGGFGHSGQ